jgi:hypothetical protein
MTTVQTRRQSLQRGATALGGFADLKQVAWEPLQRAGSLIASLTTDKQELVTHLLLTG